MLGPRQQLLALGLEGLAHARVGVLAPAPICGRAQSGSLRLALFRREHVYCVYANRRIHGRCRLAARMVASRRCALDVLRGFGQRAGTTRRLPARWARRGHGAGNTPAARPAGLSHGDVRPARLWPFDAGRGTSRQHHAASGGRHRAPARTPRDRSLDRVRRLMGQHTGAGLCAGASASLRSPGAARHLAGVDPRDAVVPGRPAQLLPRRLGTDGRTSAGRPGGRLVRTHARPYPRRRPCRGGPGSGG